MLGEEFERWLTSVKSYRNSGVANRISACRRVERELHVNLDEIYNNAQEWSTLIDSFRNYTLGEWERGIEPTHGISFAYGGNWYTGTKNILSALILYDKFKKDTDNNLVGPPQEQHEQMESTQFSLEACPNDIFQDVMNVEDSARTEECKYKSLLDKIRDNLESLEPRERFVIELRFGLRDGKPRSLEEIARTCYVSRERIRQIEAKALRKMRHP